MPRHLFAEKNLMMLARAQFCTYDESLALGHSTALVQVANEKPFEKYLFVQFRDGISVGFNITADFGLYKRCMKMYTAVCSYKHEA